MVGIFWNRKISDIRWSTIKRKETIEKVFVDAKEKYAMKYTLYQGLAQVTNWVMIKFAAMNLKKYAVLPVCVY